MNNIRYYLSFDCATKTFAYVLVKINLTYLFLNFNEIKQVLDFVKSDPNKYKGLIEKITDITSTTIQIIHADCIDLFPNVPDKDIDTVNRIKTMTTYVKTHIYPLITDIETDKLDIVIEFQMSYNTQSKIISIGLISLFTDYSVYLVNPSLKNKIYLSDSSKHNHFIDKYKSNYTANKAHALHNFKLFEEIFDQTISLSNSVKGHVADAFLQILGLILHSPQYVHVINQCQK